MTPLEFALVVFTLSVVAGALGSLVGVGGGIIVVPTLTLLFDVDIRIAMGATLVSVIATSSGSAIGFNRAKLTNFRVGLFLQVAATAGALTGAYLAGIIRPRWLYLIFGLAMGGSALLMLGKRSGASTLVGPADGLADRLRLHGSFHDGATGQDVSYRVSGSRLGILLMYAAGALSGLLGIGSGVLKVPAMDLAMRLPIKVATGTSNFMIGVTAAASAGVFLARGQVNPFVAGPVAAGVLVGATLGSGLLARLRSSVVRWVFVFVLLSVSVQMFGKGLR